MKVVPTAIAAAPVVVCSVLTATTNCDPCPCGLPQTEDEPELAWLLHPSPSQFSPSKTNVNVVMSSSPMLDDLLDFLDVPSEEPGAAHASQSQLYDGNDDMDRFASSPGEPVARCVLAITRKPKRVSVVMLDMVGKMRGTGVVCLCSFVHGF
jgi:hypothetical protein